MGCRRRTSDSHRLPGHDRLREAIQEVGKSQARKGYRQSLRHASFPRPLATMVILGVGKINGGLSLSFPEGMHSALLSAGVKSLAIALLGWPRSLCRSLRPSARGEFHMVLATLVHAFSVWPNLGRG